MAAKVSFNDKQNFVENPTIPAEQKIAAGDINELKKAVNDNATILEGKSAVLLDEVVQEQIKYTTGTTGVTDKQLCRTVINGKEVLTPIENVIFVGGRFDGKTAKEVIDNVVIFVSDNADGSITIDCPD